MLIEIKRPASFALLYEAIVVRCSIKAYVQADGKKDQPMTHYGDTMARFMSAGFDAWTVSLKIAETMAASHTVIGARMAMLDAGLDNSAVMPFAEFSRLVPEKTAAFGKAHAGAVRALGKGRVMQATMLDGMALLDWWETSIRATAAWWTPIHAQATANARRLG